MPNEMKAASATTEGKTERVRGVSLMKRDVVFSSRIGDQWTFAVEFEGIGDPPKSWNEWWGTLWLWVDGRVVGYPSEIEMVMTGFDSLMESAKEIRGEHYSSLQLSIPASDALDLVMWAGYGTEVRAPGGFVGDSSDLARYEVLPRLTGSFFDGWEAVLITTEHDERFIFRSVGAEAREAVWPAGTFRNVTQRAIDEFKRLAAVVQSFRLVVALPLTSTVAFGVPVCILERSRDKAEAVPSRSGSCFARMSHPSR